MNSIALILSSLFIFLIAWGTWNLLGRLSPGLPPSEIHRCPLDTPSLCLTFSIVILIHLLIILIVQWTHHLHPHDLSQISVIVLLGQTLTSILTLCVLNLLFKKNGTSWKMAFGLHRGKSWYLVPELGLTLIALLIPLSIAGLMTRGIFTILNWPMTEQPVLKWFQTEKNPYLLGWMVFYATLMAPLMEEILFRGLLYPWLKNRYGSISSLWISSLIFAGFHFHAPSFLSLTVLALALAWLYERHGNLLASCLLHGVFNSLSLFILSQNTYLSCVIPSSF